MYRSLLPNTHTYTSRLNGSNGAFWLVVFVVIIVVFKSLTHLLTLRNDIKMYNQSPG